MALRDFDPMPFGKHRGKMMRDVPADYLLYIDKENMCNAEVKEYIKRRRFYLQDKVERQELGRMECCGKCIHVREVIYGFSKALKCPIKDKIVGWRDPACDDDYEKGQLQRH